MNIFLIVFIAIKIVCLFFCWKAVKMTKQSTPNRTQKNKNENVINSSEDWQRAHKQMSKLMEENKKLTASLEELKKSKSS
ncbi:hypothetical protein [Halalkalibacter alkaliphilus]|uniref:Uncharacterized protein n=2 Tax=Bacillaceae TaxID=186817 RepID=A0A9X2CSE8_9BACI|nr:hypothetical protein [Halalkalibacter alkaliphilus]MCL7747290.1 hypothetical protein [Halalkalibacter alkaliphilus]